MNCFYKLANFWYFRPHNFSVSKILKIIHYILLLFLMPLANALTPKHVCLLSWRNKTAQDLSTVFRFFSFWQCSYYWGQQRRDTSHTEGLVNEEGRRPPPSMWRSMAEARAGSPHSNFQAGGKPLTQAKGMKEHLRIPPDTVPNLARKLRGKVFWFSTSPFIFS